MRLTHALLAASLALTTARAPLAAQADTIGPPKPLFTWRDAALFGVFTVGTLALGPVDKSIAHRLQDSTVQANKFFGGAATTVRNIAFPGSYVIGVGMYAYGRIAKNEKAADLGLHGTEALVVGQALGTVLKGAFGRQRPYVNIDNPHNYKFGRGFTGGSDYSSFPSGHTITAFAAASAVTSEANRFWPHSKIVWLVAPTMYGGATLVGLSRMYNNKHWASDVVAGAAIGTFAGLKVVRYHHTHPGNRIDKLLLSATILPGADGGAHVGFSVMPGW